nr:hypothetical protein [Tanacetum cinerariifolium]
VYHNVTRTTMSGAGDGDYTQYALLEYQDEYGVPFTFTHCWKELKDCEKGKQVEIPYFETSREEKNNIYKSSRSASFNT